MLPLLALVACDDDGSMNQPPDPAAVARFVNVVRDTGTVDLRFVDNLENLPTMLGVPFRGASGMYQRVLAGTRHARVFPTSTDINLTSTILVDNPSVQLSVDERVTFVYTGTAADGSDQFVRFDEPFVISRAPLGQIAIKVLHAAAGVGAVDVYVVDVASTTAATPAGFATTNVAVFSNVGFLTQSARVNMPVAPTDRFYRFVVTAAGSTTALFAATPNLPGAAPTVATGPLPGVRIEESVLTAVLSAGAIPGTRSAATTGATTTGSVTLLIDRTLDSQ